MNNLQSLYFKSPVWLQNFATSTEGWRIRRKRYGKSFFRFLETYEIRNSQTHLKNLILRDQRLYNFIKPCAFTEVYYLAYTANADIVIQLYDIQPIQEITVNMKFDKENIYFALPICLVQERYS